jgi:hypothetical protein
MSRALWRIFGTLCIAVSVLFVAFVSWQYWLFKGGIFRTSSFDETKWHSLNKVGTKDSSCYRGGMAHDIKTNVLRVGLTEAEVETLLGPPDHITETETHAYFLGMCSGLRIDFDTLDIHFDSEGRLLKVEVVQH